jgi:hypothetical protein
VIVRLDIVANIVRWTSMNALHCHVPMVEPVVNQLLVLTSVSVKMAGMDTTVMWMWTNVYRSLAWTAALALSLVHLSQWLPVSIYATAG